MHPAHVLSIQRVHLQLSRESARAFEYNRWSDACRAMAALQGLRHLTISIGSRYRDLRDGRDFLYCYSGAEWMRAEARIFSALAQITQVDVFEVFVGWSAGDALVSGLPFRVDRSLRAADDLDEDPMAADYERYQIIEHESFDGQGCRS